jgi:hypothetical protein
MEEPQHDPQQGTHADIGSWEAMNFLHHCERGDAWRQQRAPTSQPRLRHLHGGTSGNEGDPPGTDAGHERRIDFQPCSPSRGRSSDDEWIQSDSSHTNFPRAARAPPEAGHPRARRGLGGAAAAAPGAALGGHDRRARGHEDLVADLRTALEGEGAADNGNSSRATTEQAEAAVRRRQLHATEDQSGKRRRLRGKQPPSGSSAGASTGASNGNGISGVLRGRPGRSGPNSVHEGISACPSRSTTLSADRLAPADRDGQVLGAHPAAAATIRAGGLTQHGAGLTERIRGRGRPPEA